MRLMIGKSYVYVLVGLALTWLAVLGCADGSDTETSEARQPLATVTAEAAVPMAPPSPAGAVDVQAVPERVAETPVQEPTQAAVLTPAPPTPAPVAAKFSAAEREALAGSAFGYLSELAEDVGPRASATEEELEAAEFLLDRFTELGYNPALQEFETESLMGGVAVIFPEGAAGEDIRARPLSGSVSGEVSGPLEFISLGKGEDIPSEGLEGKVALIERGEITFRSKVEQAAGAGASAAIVFNNQPGLFQGTLGSGRSKIPAVGISRADGEKLRELMADSGVEVALEVEVTPGVEVTPEVEVPLGVEVTQEVEVPLGVEVAVTVGEASKASRNIIFEVPGNGDGVVILGAHYDTVPDSIGANDNSSGMGVLLALAKELAGRSFPFTLRFVAFGSEETGLHGSRHYVEQLTDEELDNIRAMINLDALGSGNTVRVQGDRWLTRHVSDAADREGIDLTVSRGFRGGGSDHASFRAVGVPAIFFHADDLSRINSPRDTMEYINPDLLGGTMVLVLDLLESLENLQR